MDDPKNIPSDPIKNTSANVPISAPISAGGKEGEVGSIMINSSELPLQDLGKEVELPKEVSAVGVQQQPVHVPVPPPVISMGVKQTASTTPISTGATIVLPLSQVQITEGMKKNITFSWRWLTEECIRRLKQIRLLRTI